MAVSVTGPGRFAVTGDLLSADGDARAWWQTQAGRVPGGDLPGIRAPREG